VKRFDRIDSNLEYRETHNLDLHMDENIPNMRDVAAMTTVISQALHFALQTLRHSVSIATVPGAEDTIAKAKLDEPMRATESSPKALETVLAPLEEGDVKHGMRPQAGVKRTKDERIMRMTNSCPSWEKDPGAWRMGLPPRRLSGGVDPADLTSSAAPVHWLARRWNPA
jgi:hypothetical protein